MGFFGMQKAEERIESPAAAEEHFEEKPALPRASSTVIAQGVTLKGTLRGEGVVQVEGDRTDPRAYQGGRGSGGWPGRG